MKTVIMAGGKGTRISKIADNIPKPLINIEGKPILEYEIECLREQGFTDIIITVGHMGQKIIDYFGNGSGISPATGKKFGVSIEYFFEEEPLGNAGALFHIKDKLTDDFLLLNADSLFNIDIKRFVNFHKAHDGLVTIFTHPNNHPYDSSLIISDENNLVLEWLSKEETRPLYYKNRVNAGLHVISPKLLEKKVDMPKVDLDRHLLKPLSGTGKLYCYDSPEYVKDMGTPDRYYGVIEDIRSGLIYRKNLRKKQKAIFMDRDGTINKYIEFLSKLDQFELIQGVSEAIKKINSSGYLAIVVTNQPVVARGEITINKLKNIHNKMETLLGDDGGYIDRIYFCPHHPDKGFKGERPEYKIDCKCRKPKPGMLELASKEYNIDLNKSFMIGDSENDILAGKAAGCRTALIGNENYNQDYTVKSLNEFVDIILQ